MQRDVWRFRKSVCDQYSDEAAMRIVKLRDECALNGAAA